MPVQGASVMLRAMYGDHLENDVYGKLMQGNRRISRKQFGFTSPEVRLAAGLSIAANTDHRASDLSRSTEMFGRLADPNGANNALSQVLYGLALRSVTAHFHHTPLGPSHSPTITDSS